MFWGKFFHIFILSTNKCLGFFPFCNFYFHCSVFSAKLCQHWKTGRFVQFQSPLVTLPLNNCEDLEKEKGGKSRETLSTSRVNAWRKDIKNIASKKCRIKNKYNNHAHISKVLHWKLWITCLKNKALWQITAVRSSDKVLCSWVHLWFWKK